MNNTYNNFIKIGKLEGYSYLILLFIAMPLRKYFHIHLAVTVAGMIHGLLFILFMILVYLLYSDKKFGFKEALIAFLLSIIPFGTFFLHRIPYKNAN